MRTDPFDLTGKTVIVTGATMGLGRVIAERFLHSGAEVVACARREPAEPVAAAGREAHFVAADVRDPEQVQAVVAEAVRLTGRVDVLVNNAGGAPPAETATVSPRFNEKIIALNLLAPLTFAQAVHPVMSAQDTGGVIINISSISGSRPNPAGAAYGAAKAGLANLTQTLALELGAGHPGAQRGRSVCSPPTRPTSTTATRPGSTRWAPCWPWAGWATPARWPTWSSSAPRHWRRTCPGHRSRCTAEERSPPISPSPPVRWPSFGPHPGHESPTPPARRPRHPSGGRRGPPCCWAPRPRRRPTRARTRPCRPTPATPSTR